MKVVKVDFAGSEIECVEMSGRIYASVRDLCRGIGLDYMTQLTALREMKCDVRMFKLPSGEIMNAISLEHLQEWLDILKEAIDHRHLIEKNAKGDLSKNIDFNA